MPDSRPFTEARPFLQDLFETGRQDIPIPASRVQSGDDAPARWDEAAAALRQNVLWKSVEQHFVMGEETSCRTAIDLVVLTAIDLAQSQMAHDGAVDDAVSTRHALSDPKQTDSNGHQVGSWVVVHQEVEVPSQPLLPGLALHGILDYLIGVVSAKQAHDAFDAGDGFLRPATLDGPLEPLEHVAGSTVASIIEAKTGIQDDMACYQAQATAQGAALCLLTERTSIINALTDGVYWKFFRVSKTPDEVLRPTKSTRARRATTSALPTEGRRTSQQLATKAAGMTTISEKKPFKVASTRFLNIFKGRDLALVLRLLTLSILETPEDFEKLAA
ncbi:hypothetical protein B0H16DRAFT_110892 [Mycena metata]|uniref:Uncharacterized protein n=1 Tax=Mycena metata TaxID=1033252 RepID=A0AAD7MYX7_9AGAR|nr:hypothetical protein B0H16DRAFT_110892 [Mycena metata]